MLRELHSLVGGLFSKSQAEEKVVNSYFWALLKYENKIIWVSQCSLHQQLYPQGYFGIFAFQILARLQRIDEISWDKWGAVEWWRLGLEKMK